MRSVRLLPSSLTSLQSSPRPEREITVQVVKVGHHVKILLAQGFSRVKIHKFQVTYIGTILLWFHLALAALTCSGNVFGVPRTQESFFLHLFQQRLQVDLFNWARSIMCRQPSRHMGEVDGNYVRTTTLSPRK